MNKKNVVYFLPLVLLVAFCFYLFVRPNTILYPDPANKGAYYTFSDKKYDGNSFVIMKQMNDFVFFELYVKSGYEEPYAGFTFNLPRGNRLDQKELRDYFDMSDYDRVKLNLSTKNVKNIDFSINTFEPKISDTLDPVSYRHNTLKIHVAGDTSEYMVYIKDARTPNWWFKDYNISESELPAPNWSVAYNLSFLAHIDADGPPGLVTVKSITFYKNYWKYLAPALLLFFIYYIVVGLLWANQKKKKRQKEVVVTYVQRPLEDHKSIEENSVINFIAENYHLPDLSISSVTEATGISQRAVSKILYDDLGKTFKSYLNDLRLREAKRLLLCTRNSISEIAYAVGFNSPNSFNRVFRVQEDTTPSAYRKIAKEFTEE
ncbi:helix-turn-helix domain-containing protein [Aquimarina pacifica]|uniref:helix-turn-helix domain-containing protein n=1 Tax=Aquimarina pacifica TaxID=1296415 RepID=UPI000472C085|nr:AraC family transcriptional regulator [Aquimarina pacifica]